MAKIGLPGAILMGSGALLGGVTLYDLLKKRGIGEDPEKFVKFFGRSTVDAKEYIRKRLSEGRRALGLDRPLKIIVSEKDLDKAVKSDKDLDDLMVLGFLDELRSIVAEKQENAMMIPTPGNYYLISPPKVSRRVLDHEIGHAQHMSVDPSVINPSVIKRIASLFWKPSYKEMIMDPEVEAWRRAKVRASDTLRSEALKGYEGGFHSRRAELLGLLGTALVLGGAATLK
jgi:hypothetical protein